MHTMATLLLLLPGPRDRKAEVSIHVPGHSHPVGGGLSSLHQATTQLAGFSLGRLGWGLRKGWRGREAREGRGPEERGGSSPGDTVQAARSQTGLSSGGIQ